MILVSNHIFLAMRNINFYFARLNIKDGGNFSRWLPFPALKSFFGVVLPQLFAPFAEYGCVVDVVPVFIHILLDGFLALVLAMEHGLGEIQALGD